MRIKAIVLRIIRQFIRDKRTMALMIIAPIFVLFLMSLVFKGADYVPDIAITDTVPSMVVTKVEEAKANVSKFTEEEAEELIKQGKVDAIMAVTDMQLQITLEGSDLTANRAVMMVLQRALGAESDNENQPQITYLHGSDTLEPFDYMGPILIGVFIFFFVFIIAGVSFLRERSRGTLERMLSTPLKRSEIVLGYIIGFGIFTSVQSAIISWYSISVLGMWMVGSIWYVLLVTLLLAMVALTLGILLSTFANNELQVVQFIPIVIIPQIFLSGLFSLEAMSPFLRGFSAFMPLTYGANSLSAIMLRGGGWEAIQTDIFVLLGFSLVFMLLNIMALKKHRRM
ncbi:ABC transporter permease [Anaerobacillus sp. MEB173]|uniref:ABC transporter permease n=1 Tax=Anaerobacillus sp. MEB173 TaxID=3383345 RepID=UPI003F8F5975